MSKKTSTEEVRQELLDSFKLFVDMTGQLPVPEMKKILRVLSTKLTPYIDEIAAEVNYIILFFINFLNKIQQRK